MKTKSRIFIASIVMLILATFGTSPVYSQANVQYVSITTIDSENFPDVVVSTRIKDASNNPVDMLTAQDFQLTEDKSPVDFTLERTRVGLNTVLVLDFNAGITTTGATGGSRLDETKWVAQHYVDKMGEGDQAAILVVRPDGVSLVQEFTQDKDALSKSIEGMTANPTTEMSFTLDGVEMAIQKLKDTADQKRDKAVLLMSPGILTAKGTGINSGLVNIGRALNDTDISIHCVLVRSSNQSYWLDQLASIGSGQYTHFTDQASIDALFNQIEGRAWQYEFKFRSQSGAYGERLLSIGLAGSDVALTSKSYSVQPAPAAPEITAIIVNNGDPVRRVVVVGDETAESSLDEANLRVSVDWPDGYLRNLVRAEFGVDNQPAGSPYQNPENDFSLVWDLRGFNTLGSSTAFVRVTVYDELGFSDSQELQIPVEVVAGESLDGSGLCTSLAKLPGAGAWLGKTCRSMGLTASQLVIFIILILVLVLIALLWFKRATVSKVAGEMGGAVSDIIERVTLRLKKSEGKQAKAKLIAIQGISGGERNQFDIFGETLIGRDRNHCVLIFSDYPAISREHVALHENKADGAWTIEDRDSANGTYVNGKALEPFDKTTPLKHGDIIELAEVQQGGIKFRFEICGDGNEKEATPAKRGRKAAHQEQGDSTLVESNDIRETHPIPRTRPAESGRRSAEEDRFDPSQQTY